MKLYVSLILSLISVSLYADNIKWDSLNNWGGTGFSMLHADFPDGSFKSFHAVINDDIEGKKVLEFRYFSHNQKECIRSKSSQLNDIIIKVSNTRVKMKVGCDKEAFITYLRYYATTQKGREFLVKKFSLEKPVLVELQGYKLNFPSKGFTKAWEEYGSDAI